VSLRRTLTLLAPVLAGALALAGCPGGGDVTPASDAGPEAAPDSPTDCPAGFLGDPNKDIEVELRALKADGTDVPLKDGDDLAIVFPPQGGRVAFVGIRAINLDGCGVQVTGALRDLGSRQVRVDGRTVNLRKEEADGWGTTGQGTTTNIEDSAAIGDYSNVPLCPNQWADVDVFDKPFEVEVLVKDRRKKSATKIVKVTPRCSEPGAKETACRCLCKHGYMLGETCGEDAGVPDGGQ
jgi:hypothetical protein